MTTEEAGRIHHSTLKKLLIQWLHETSYYVLIKLHADSFRLRNLQLAATKII